MRKNRDFHNGVTRRARALRRQIGANIHAHRVRRNVTMEKLSRLSGLSVRCIDHLEMGKGEASLRHLICLSLALSVSVDDILAGDIVTPAA
ncbi:MAG: helix-turn-helix domain-containing protein [Alphaproteobacteria bacterium]